MILTTSPSWWRWSRPAALIDTVEVDHVEALGADRQHPEPNEVDHVEALAKRAWIRPPPVEESGRFFLRPPLIRFKLADP